jgi:nucleoside-diphosphate-sugar epimerase
MKVLVIGGAGYIGSVLSQRLWQQGYQVTVLDQLLFGGESILHLFGKPGFRLVQGDLRDEQVLADVLPGHDAVILLAAIVGEPACNRDPETAVETNLHGTLKVLSASRQAGVERFVFSSTCSNYGVSEADTLVAENAPLQPISTYAETKVQAEREILAAAGNTFHPTVLRLSTAFGVSPRMRFDLLVSDFTLAAIRDGKIVVYGEQFWRPFVHVQDISAAIEMVLQSDPTLISGEVFNVGCNDNNIQKLDLAESICRQVANTELEFVERVNDPRSYRVNFDKIGNRLDYRAQWSIEDGIREAYAALRAQIWRDTSDSRFYN